MAAKSSGKPAPAVAGTGGRSRATGCLNSLRTYYSFASDSNSILIPSVVKSIAGGGRAELIHGCRLSVDGCGLRCTLGLGCTASIREGEAVSVWYAVCAILAVLLFAYLFVAMLKPEWF